MSRFCKDCKHYKGPIEYRNKLYHNCVRPHEFLNQVSGKPWPLDANNERAVVGQQYPNRPPRCGESGQFFERKRSLPDAIPQLPSLRSVE